MTGSRTSPSASPLRGSSSAEIAALKAEIEALKARLLLVEMRSMQQTHPMPTYYPSGPFHPTQPRWEYQPWCTPMYEVTCRG